MSNHGWNRVGSGQDYYSPTRLNPPPQLPFTVILKSRALGNSGDVSAARQGDHLTVQIRRNALLLRSHTKPSRIASSIQVILKIGCSLSHKGSTRRATIYVYKSHWAIKTLNKPIFTFLRSWESARLQPVSRVRFPDPASYVGWVCCWLSTLLRFFSGYPSP